MYSKAEEEEKEEKNILSVFVDCIILLQFGICLQNRLITL